MMYGSYVFPSRSSSPTQRDFCREMLLPSFCKGLTENRKKRLCLSLSCSLLKLQPESNKSGKIVMVYLPRFSFIPSCSGCSSFVSLHNGEEFRWGPKTIEGIITNPRKCISKSCLCTLAISKARKFCFQL